MAGKYDGLEQALRVIKPGGFYIVDDLLPQANWPAGHAAKIPALMEQLSQHQNFFMTPLAWASGIILAVKRN